MLILDPKSVLKALRELKPVYRTGSNDYRQKKQLECLEYVLVVGDSDGYYLAYLDDELYYSRVEITALGDGCYPILPHVLRDICKVSDGLITMKDYQAGEKSRWNPGYRFSVMAEGCTWTINTISLEDMPPLHRISVPEVIYA